MKTETTNICPACNTEAAFYEDADNDTLVFCGTCDEAVDFHPLIGLRLPGESKEDWQTRLIQARIKS